VLLCEEGRDTGTDTQRRAKAAKRRRVRGRERRERGDLLWARDERNRGRGERDRRTDGNAGGRSGVAVKEEDVREVRCIEAMGGCVVYIEAA
jgi:hypothetical protein